MPQIYEDGQAQWVSPREAEVLTELGFITTCPGCDSFHHEEFERWVEIGLWLKVMRGQPIPFEPMEPAPAAVRLIDSRTRRRHGRTP